MHAHTIIFRFIFSFVLAVSTLIGEAEPSGILMIFDKPGTSHYNDAVAVATLLHNQGYNISFLIPSIYQNDTAIQRDLGMFSFISTRYHKDDIDFFQESDRLKSEWGTLFTFFRPFKVMEIVINQCRDFAVTLLSDVEMADELTRYNFDMVVFEGSFTWYHPLVQRLNLPYVVLTTSADVSTNNLWFNTPSQCSTLPTLFMDVPTKIDVLSFYWRSLNCVGTAASIIFFTNLLGGQMHRGTVEYSKYVRTDPITSFGQADMWMTNSDPATDLPRSYLPATIFVGGLSIEEPKVLDEEYEAIIKDSGDHGILVVTLGTVVQTLSQEKADAMATAFAKLPQTVVWRETLPRPRFVGNNTIIKPWIPQRALLANPKTRAVLFHCGNNGAFEALFYGVPVISMPIYADQFDVAYRISSGGMGLTVNHKQITNESLFETITEVIQNPSYRQRAQLLSAVYRDHTHPAKERAAFWIQYILRHGGNRLQKVKISEMGFLEKYLIDVGLALMLFALVLLYITKRAISTVSILLLS